VTLARLEHRKLTALPPAELRRRFRAGLDVDTAGLAPEFVQASVSIVPEENAADFLAFCTRNPSSCPLLEVLEPGQWEPRAAPGADVRTDLPAYRVARDGDVVTVPDLLGVWRDDLVAFILGCGYTHIGPLIEAGVSLHHLDRLTQQPVYVSNIETRPADPFRGPVAVSMMALPGDQVATAVRVTARYPFAHGAPIWIGDPARIGIDLSAPATGDPPELAPGDTPVFWACSQTPWLAAAQAGLPFFAQHAPARMLITELKASVLVDGLA